MFDFSNNEGMYVDDDYKEYELLRKPKMYEQGTYCEWCAKQKFGFKND